MARGKTKLVDATLHTAKGDDINGGRTSLQITVVTADRFVVRRDLVGLSYNPDWELIHAQIKLTTQH